MNFNKSKRNIILLHLMVWMMLFSIPYILAKGEHEILVRMIENTWIPLVFYAVVFYLNYLYLIDKFFFEKKYKLFFILNLVMIIAFVLIISQFRHLFFDTITNIPKPVQEFSTHMDRKPPKKLFLYMDVLWFIIPLAFSIALKSFDKLKKTETEKQESEKIKLEQELQYLRYQLQPHFFFNSLNNIYSLVDIAPEKAKESIHSLSKLMRFLLYESNTPEVSITKEIEFMTTYIELMKLRFSEKTTITYSFPNVKEHVMIPPLLFISLVENAFKHGVSATKKSEIDFEMTYDENELVFMSINNYFPKSTIDKSGSGIGLVNLDKRLLLLFKDHYELSTEVKEGKYIAKLTIKL